MHRKLPKTPKLLLKTNQFIRQRQQWLEHCLFLVIMSLGEEKIGPSRSHPSILCFYSWMRHGKIKCPRLLAPPFPSCFSGCRKVSWGGGGTRETHHSPSIVLLMLLPSSLLLEMGQQMSQAITPAQASISTLGLSQQVNMDLELY